MVEEIDYRRLAAEIQEQRQLFAPGRNQRPSHFAEDVHIRAAKAIDRLLAVTHYEEIRARAGAQHEFLQQCLLQSIRVLKLINQEISVALSGSPDNFGAPQQLERTYLQIVKIQRRKLLLLL